MFRTPWCTLVLSVLEHAQHEHDQIIWRMYGNTGKTSWDSCTYFCTNCVYKCFLLQKIGIIVRRWIMSHAHVLCAMQKCQRKGYTMVAFLAIHVEHFSEEQPRKMVLKNASLKENVALRIRRESLAHRADMKSA